MEEKSLYQINNKSTFEVEKDDPNVEDTYYTNESYKKL